VRVSRVQERTAGPVSDVRRVRWDRDRHGCVPSPVRVGRHDVRDRIVLSLDRHGMIDNTVDLASTVRSGEMSLDIGILYDLDVLYGTKKQDVSLDPFVLGLSGLFFSRRSP
jgi:hypothetical protein